MLSSTIDMRFFTLSFFVSGLPQGRRDVLRPPFRTFACRTLSKAAVLYSPLCYRLMTI